MERRGQGSRTKACQESRLTRFSPLSRFSLPSCRLSTPSLSPPPSLPPSLPPSSPSLRSTQCRTLQGEIARCLASLGFHCDSDVSTCASLPPPLYLHVLHPSRSIPLLSPLSAPAFSLSLLISLVCFPSFSSPPPFPYYKPQNSPSPPSVHSAYLVLPPFPLPSLPPSLAPSLLPSLPPSLPRPRGEGSSSFVSGPSSPATSAWAAPTLSPRPRSFPLPPPRPPRAFLPNPPPSVLGSPIPTTRTGLTATAA
jgi:hypothetical protein